MRSALQFRDVLDAAVPAFIIYVTTLDDRRYTRIYPWIVPSQLAFTWIGRRSLRLGLKLKPELAIRFPGLTVLDASNHEQGDHHWNDIQSWARSAPTGVAEGVLMSTIVYGLTRLDTCWILAILSFSVPMISQIKSPFSLFFCSCAILLAGQQPLSDWYTAITISIVAFIALGTVYLGRRLREDEARGEQDGKLSRLSVFSGFVGMEQELVIALVTSIFLLLIQSSEIHAPTWSGIGLLVITSLLFTLSSMASKLAAKGEDRPQGPSFVPFIILAIVVGYFARGHPIDRRWAHLALTFGLATAGSGADDPHVRDYSEIDGVDELDTLKESGKSSSIDSGEARCDVRVEVEASSSGPSQTSWKRMGVAALIALPIVTALGQQAAQLRRLGHHNTAMRNDGQEGIIRSPTWKARSDYDLVISYYNEDLETIRNTIEQVKKRLPGQTTSRTIVYAKGPNSASRAAMSEFLQKIDADEIVALKNVGREGETYLQHIVRHYSSTDSPLATHTIFLQPHIPWPGTAFPRLESMTANTGFMSLSTYVNASCPADGSEIDVLDQVHPRIAQIYSSFQQDLCPSTGFTITWFGQFVASRQRIHRNPLRAYQNLLDYFDVPVGEGHPKDWIWDEGWWNNSPDNPTLGHALERSWPAVFGCSDLKLAFECKDESGPHCMCMD